MSTNITIENAVGTNLVIPEAGAKRRGEINITANNGFFKVDRTDQAVIPFTSSHTLTNAGATITGNTEDINNDVPIENIPADIFGCRIIRNSDSGSSASGIMQLLDKSIKSMSVVGANNDFSIQTFQNVLGQDIKVFRKHGAVSVKYQFTDGYGWYSPLPLNINVIILFNIYIEDDTINNDTILFEIEGIFRLYRDRYQVYASGWQDAVNYNNNYSLPAQQWVTVMIDTTVGQNTLRPIDQIHKVTFTDDNGENIIDNISQQDARNYMSLILAYNGDDTSNNYIKYSPIFFLGKEKGIQLLGQDGWSKFVDSMKRLITPA